MAGEIQLNSTTMATESSGSITAQLDTIRPNTLNGSLVLQGDSSDAGVTGLTIDSSGVVNTTTAKVTNIQATSGQSLTIKDEDGNTAITVGTDNTAAGYLSLNFASYHGDSSGAGSGTRTGNTLDDYEEGTWTPSALNVTASISSYSAKYTKIGRIVNVYGYIVFSSLDNSDTSSLTIGGLPFSVDTDGNSLGTINRKYGVSPIFTASGTSDVTGIRVESNNFLFCKAGNTGTNPFLLYTDCNSSGEFSFGLTYFSS